MRVVLDTGPLVTLLNRRDAYHRWSVEQATGLQPPRRHPSSTARRSIRSSSKTPRPTTPAISTCSGCIR